MEDGSVVNLEFNSKEDLMIQENNDAEVKVDIQKFFHTFAPQTTDPSMSYPQHTYEGPNNMPAHIKSLLLPTHYQLLFQVGNCSSDGGKASIFLSIVMHHIHAT